jgi:Fe-Mn family superoxide dismutase
MKHELQSLPYAYDALEPYIDAKTMEVHHSKHHQAYSNKLNEALATLEKSHPEIVKVPLEELLKNPQYIPQDIRQAVINNGGGAYNHDLFWKCMSPNGMREPSGVLAKTMQESFESYDNFWKQFSVAAMGQFGSGWGWLVITHDKKIKITTTGNQDNPLSAGEYPLLAIDVWEHAYYLKYQNRRADYIEAWKSVIDWTEAVRRYEDIMGVQHP